MFIVLLEDNAAVRGLWISLAVLIIAGLAGCQAVMAGSAPDISQQNEGLALVVTQPQDESIVRSNPLVVSGNTSPGAQVMVNDMAVAVDSGHFSLSLELEPGPNCIEIQVKDGSGRQAFKELTVVYVP